MTPLNLIAAGGRGRLSLTNSIIICDGNSLTFGTPYGDPNASPPIPGIQSYPSQLAGMAPFTTNGATIYNFGIGGQTTLQMSADAASQIDSLYNPAVTCIVVASEWLNDVSVNGGTAAALYAHIVTYYNARKAAGFRCGICTNHAVNHAPGSSIAPSGDTYTVYFQKVQAINALILAATDIDAADIIRFDNIPQLMDEYDTTYFQASDNVHLTQAGYLIRAQAVRDWLVNLRKS